MRELRVGEYILITDEEDKRFLEIGCLEGISYDFDGVAKGYTVRFKGGIEEYGYDLEDKCKILNLEKPYK